LDSSLWKTEESGIPHRKSRLRWSLVKVTLTLESSLWKIEESEIPHRKSRPRWSLVKGTLTLESSLWKTEKSGMSPWNTGPRWSLVKGTLTLESSLWKTEESGMSPWKSGRGGGGVRNLSYTPDLADSGLGWGRGGVLQILTVHFLYFKCLIVRPPENKIVKKGE
jgi:hypothetical protein